MPIRVARAVVLLGLSVSPSQAALEPLASGQERTLVNFTHYARQLLSADTKGHDLRLKALNQALEQQLLVEAEKELSDDAIATYGKDHALHFQTPDAIALWRLLVASEAQAKELLSAIKHSQDPVRTWGVLVREQSLDKATHFRRGSLGYVRADGSTDIPQVRVAPTLFEAAKSLADGELLPHPIREGQNWALIWRRAARPASNQPIDQVQVAIRQQLSLSRARIKHAELTAQLRNSYVSDYHPERLDSFNPGPEAFQRQVRTAISPRAADRSPVPRETDLGER